MLRDNKAMSTSDASIDPLLRNIAPSTTTYHSTSPLVAAAANTLQQSLEYESSSPYLQPQHQQLQLQRPLHDTTHTENRSPRDEGSLHDPKRSRACEACRGLKVRCEPDPNNPDAPCKRCTKANRNCVITAPSRKRQKKADSRVAELEKKIDTLTATLVAQRTTGVPINQMGGNEYSHSLSTMTPSRHDSYEQVINGRYGSPYIHRLEKHGEDWLNYPKIDHESKTMISPLTTASRKRKQADNSIAQTVSSIPGFEPFPKIPCEPMVGWSGPKIKTPSPPTSPEYVDVVDRGLITAEIAAQMFQLYVDKLAPQMPVVVFPPETTWMNVRKSTPILFLAILEASSAMNFPHLQQLLTNEIMAIYADRTIYNTLKSLEIIQALQVSTIWYWPPEYVKELKIYQLVHFAAVIGIDIGLGRKSSPKPKRSDLFTRQSRYRSPCIDPESMEARRAWLGCYWLCSNVSMILQRPSIIRRSSFIEDCVNVLNNSAEALPSDKFLCQSIESQYIAEKIGVQLSRDSPLSLVNTTECAAHYKLKIFEKDMEDWKATTNAERLAPTLQMTEHVLNLYMHEVSLYMDNHGEEAHSSSVDDTGQALVNDQDHLSLSPARVNSLSVCLTSIDGIFETFLSLNTETIRCLPTVYFVRVAHAVVALINLYLESSTPDSELGSVLDKENMKVEQYLDRLLEAFEAASAEEKSRPSSKFLAVLRFLKNWFQRQQELNAQQLEVSPDVSNSPTKLVDGTATGANKQKISLSSPGNSKQSQVNTPLQLLSEVAAGSSGGQPGPKKSNNITSPTNSSQESTQLTPSLNHSNTPLPNGQTHGPINTSGNIDPTLTSNLGYIRSNSLEQEVRTALQIKEFGPYFGDDALFGGLMDLVMSLIVGQSV